MLKPKVELRLCQVSTFKDGSPLCEIWDDQLSQHYAQAAVEDYLETPAVCQQAEPVYEIHLLRSDSELGEQASVIIGITGAFFPEGELGADFKTAWGLRWHGIIPAYRGLGYSAHALNALCDSPPLEAQKRERPNLIELLPPHRPTLAHHFASNGFTKSGSLRANHPLYPGWLVYQRSLTPLAIG